MTGPESGRASGSQVEQCPRCGESIPLGMVLPEYSREDGGISQFAECPSCAAVVQPA